MTGIKINEETDKDLISNDKQQTYDNDSDKEIASESALQAQSDTKATIDNKELVDNVLATTTGTAQPRKPVKPASKAGKKPATKTKFDKFVSIDDRIAQGVPQQDFDEVPVGLGQGTPTFQISEYPEGSKSPLILSLNP